MIVTIPGYSTIIGRPERILSVMQEARMFDSHKGDAYINAIKETAKRLFDVDLNVEGETYAERAESLLLEMAKNKMIIIEERKSR